MSRCTKITSKDIHTIDEFERRTRPFLATYGGVPFPTLPPSPMSGFALGEVIMYPRLLKERALDKQKQIMTYLRDKYAIIIE